MPKKLIITRLESCTGNNTCLFFETKGMYVIINTDKNTVDDYGYINKESIEDAIVNPEKKTQLLEILRLLNHW